MGKFDGYLICTDLDGTLLTNDKRVSQENIDAIKYFMSEGGLFTFATGRVPEGARATLDYIVPNAPIVTFNGGSIYDYSTDEFLWSSYLPPEAIEVVECIDREYPYAGIAIATARKLNYCKINDRVLEHSKYENIEVEEIHYKDIKEPWQKVLFIMEMEYVEGIKKLIYDKGFTKNYSFVQSARHYYEQLPLGMTKGAGVLKLAEILGIEHKKLIVIGDNDNDKDMVKYAGIGVAVANAVDCVKDVADWITVDNENHAIASVIKKLEKTI